MASLTNRAKVLEQKPMNFMERLYLPAIFKGMAITFICQEDMYRFVRIEELIERKLDKKHPPEHIGNGPEWDASAKKSRYSSGGRGGRPQSGGGKGGSHRGNRR